MTKSTDQSFLTALLECIHAVFYYPRSSKHLPSRPLRDEEPDRQSLREPSSTDANYQIIGNPQIHLANVRRALTIDCYRAFFTGGQDILPMYISRPDFEDKLKLDLLDGGYFKVIGVTGSGKSTLLYWAMHDLRSERDFAYVNIANRSLELYGETSLQSADFSSKEPSRLALATFRSNLSKLIFKVVAPNDPVPDQISPGELAEFLRTLPNASRITIVFDDLDTLPLMLQRTVIQFAIDLKREETATVVCIRTGGVKRLIMEGIYADYVSKVEIPAMPGRGEGDLWDTRKRIRDITADQLIALYSRRLEVLIQSPEANAYFRHWHSAAFNHFLRSDLRTLRTIPTTHWEFLVNECDLFNCCNRSIRMATDMVATIFAEVLTEVHESIDPARFLNSSSHRDGKIHSALRDLLLEKVLEGGAAQLSFPSIFTTHDDKSVYGFSVRALEILGLNDGITMREWITFVNYFYPDLSEKQVKDKLKALCQQIATSDPICVYQEAEIDSRVNIMPAGRYYVSTLASTVEFLARVARHKMDVGYAKLTPAKRVDRALGSIEVLLEKWVAGDVKLLREGNFEGSWLADIRSHHYCDRAIRGVRAFVNGGYGLSFLEKEAALLELEDLGDRLREFQD